MEQQTPYPSFHQDRGGGGGKWLKKSHDELVIGLVELGKVL